MYHTQSNSFSMLFSMANGHSDFDEGEMYSFATSPSASVDCTLSLGTPSTRGSNDNCHNQYQHEKKRSSCMSNFRWNILPSKQTPLPPTSSSAVKGHRGGNNDSGDPLLARRCANCDTTSTPLWRNGPRGPKSLCNACGIRFKKEERRATAAGRPAYGAHVDSQHMMNGSWTHQAQKTPCYSSTYGNEIRFIEDNVVDNRDSETMQFLSWCLNVADRPGLGHDFTR